MADFIAGWISGSSSIIVGNPLDVIKVRFQSQSFPTLTTTPTPSTASSPTSSRTITPVSTASFAAFTSVSSLLRGTAPPIIGYGALNAVLFYTYNRSLSFLQQERPQYPPSLGQVWAAGALGGLACFVISTPTELVKCRAQVLSDGRGSWAISKDIWKKQGLRGFYLGGGVTSVRDAVGYGFYFLTYEGVKDLLKIHNETVATLVAGGIAGCATWASIYPLDLIKTRVQLQSQSTQPLLPSHQKGYSTVSISSSASSISSRASIASQVGLGAWEHTKIAYREGGIRVFFNGFWACMTRAFLVNSVQWGVYEYLKKHISWDKS